MLYFTLIIIGILCGTEIDIFVPSFPELQKQFNLTPFMVELTLSINLLAHGISCLFVGNLGDRYGHRPVIIGSLMIFIFGSLCCVFAADFWQILAGRFMQGIGIAGPSVLSFLVISDMFAAEKQAHIMGTLNGTTTLAMAGAPIFGSYISLHLHWRGNFSVLLLLGAIALLLSWLYLPQGRKQGNVQLSLKSYLPVLRSSLFLHYTLAVQCVCLSYWVFVGMAPILYMQDLGVKLGEYGWYMGTNCLLFAMMSFATKFFLERFGRSRCFFASAIVNVFFLICVAALIYYEVHSALIITIVFCILAMANVIPINILWPMSLDSVPGAKGRVSALMAIIRLGTLSIGLQVVSYFYVGRFLELGVSIFLFSLCGLIFGLILVSRYKIFQAKPVANI